MSMLDAVKDKVVGQAMRLMSDPRISRVMGDQRVMSAAMKAVGVGGSIKAELDRATRFAAGLLGFATQEEVSALRSTVQTLEDNLAVMESKAQASAQNRGTTTQGAVR
jgi:cell division FtsZ-interacting protein ZapD